MVTFRSIGTVETKENDLLNVLVSDQDTVKIVGTYFQNDDEFTLSYMNIIRLRELLNDALNLLNE
jgi:hypothetical protein